MIGLGWMFNTTAVFFGIVILVAIVSIYALGRDMGMLPPAVMVVLGALNGMIDLWILYVLILMSVGIFAYVVIVPAVVNTGTGGSGNG